MKHIEELPHWIIIHQKKAKIWLRPFLSSEEARHELDYQNSIHPNPEWKVEERWSLRSKNDEGF